MTNTEIHALAESALQRMAIAKSIAAGPSYWVQMGKFQAYCDLLFINGTRLDDEAMRLYSNLIELEKAYDKPERNTTQGVIPVNSLHTYEQHIINQTEPQ